MTPLVTDSASQKMTDSISSEREPVEDRPFPSIGLIGVLATATMLFTAFTAAYIIRRTASDWERIPMPTGVWLSTALLVIASLLLEQARVVDRASRRRWLGATAMIALGFLASQFASWERLAGEGLFLQSNPHASFFYLLTGIHGLHVLGGLGALAWAGARPAFVQSCAYYWHFLYVIWVWVALLLWVL